jgi:hypothetical protein
MDRALEHKYQKIMKYLFILWIILPLLNMAFQTFFYHQDWLFSYYKLEMILLFGGLIGLLLILFLGHRPKISLSIETFYLHSILKAVLLTIPMIGFIIYQFEFLSISNLIQDMKYPIPFFIQWTLILSTMLLYLSARHEKIYLFHKYIALPKREYLKKILKSTVFIILSSLIGCLIITMLMFLQNSESELTLIYAGIFLFFFLIAMLYFILSMMEKFHYDELNHHQAGKTFLLSKNTAMLVIMISFSMYIISMLSSYSSHLYIIGGPVQNMPRFFLDGILARVVRGEFLRWCITLLAYGIAYRSLMRAFQNHQSIKIYAVFYSINLLMHLFSLVVAWVMRTYHPLMGNDWFVNMARWTSYFNLFSLFYNLIILVIFAVFLLRKNYSFGLLLIIQVIISFIRYVSMVFLPLYRYSALQFQITIVAGLITFVLTVWFYLKAANTIVIQPLSFDTSSLET